MAIDWDLWGGEGADGADYSQSLYDLAKHFNCKLGLEIGVRFGKSALPFLLAHEDSFLTGVDPNPEFDIVNFMVKQGVADRFCFVQDASPQAIPTLGITPKSLDWVYIDGEHTYHAIINDYKATKDLVKPGGIIVFDDVRKDLGYNTETLEALEALGLQWKTSKDYGLTENPHGCAVVEVK